MADEPAPAEEQPQPGMALERRQVQQEVIKPLDTQQVVQAMTDHQALLRELLDPTDWQGEPNADRSFVKKSGWRKVALAYNLSVERVHEEVERDENGKPLRASYTARAVAPTGRTMESTGHCAYAESRFSGPNGNESKLENDMRATAETRAKNRAISDLIGMGKVSAEEAQGGAGGGPPHGPEQKKLDGPRAALGFLLSVNEDVQPDSPEVEEVLAKIRGGLDDYLPVAAAVAIVQVAHAVRNATPTEDDAPAEGDAPPAAEPPPDAEVVDGEATPE